MCCQFLYFILIVFKDEGNIAKLHLEPKFASLIMHPQRILVQFLTYILMNPIALQCLCKFFLHRFGHKIQFDEVSAHCT